MMWRLHWQIMVPYMMQPGCQTISFSFSTSTTCLVTTIGLDALSTLQPLIGSSCLMISPECSIQYA